MPIIHFIGKVFPSSLTVNFADTQVTFDMGNGERVVITLRISNSNVETVCDLKFYEPSLMNELLARSNDLARMCLNLGSFATAVGMILVFETFVSPDGEHHPIIFEDPRVRGFCTAFEFPPVSVAAQTSFAQVFSLAMADISLMGALNDLAGNLVVHHQTPIVCGRVLDALRRSLEPSLKPIRGWPTLHRELNIDRRYAEWVSEQSTDPRHGGWGHIPDAVIREILQRTWIIMNRFVEYRKRGSQALCSPDFDLLLSTHEPS